MGVDGGFFGRLLYCPTDMGNRTRKLDRENDSRFCAKNSFCQSALRMSRTESSSPTTTMAAAASRIELALCFEDVAKNIFGNADGTMTRCAPYEPGVPHRSNARKASSSPRFP